MDISGLNISAKNKIHQTNKNNYMLVIRSEVKVAQSCLTRCDPMEYRVHRILQARILEWVAFPFSPGDFLNPGYKKHTLKIRAGKIENKRIEKYKPCKW